MIVACFIYQKPFLGWLLLFILLASYSVLRWYFSEFSHFFDADQYCCLCFIYPNYVNSDIRFVVGFMLLFYGCYCGCY